MNEHAADFVRNMRIECYAPIAGIEPEHDLQEYERRARCPCLRTACGRVGYGEAGETAVQSRERLGQTIPGERSPPPAAPSQCGSLRPGTRIGRDPAPRSSCRAARSFPCGSRSGCIPHPFSTWSALPSPRTCRPTSGGRARSGRALPARCRTRAGVPCWRSSSRSAACRRRAR